MELWHGYQIDRFEFEGRDAVVVIPKVACAGRHFAHKTEYWDAFPEAAQLGLLERGYHLCHVRNEHRWGSADQIERQARFICHVREKYNLAEKCTLVGMSCGGLQAIKLAAQYPELVSALYLDAPVLNYMSCPCSFGVGDSGIPVDEVLKALKLESISQLLSYRDMPLDKLPQLVSHEIPVVMVAGDSDRVVPYVENGILLEEAYRKAGLPFECYIKPGCDHHPHGLEDPVPVLDFIIRYDVK